MLCQLHNVYEIMLTTLSLMTAVIIHYPYFSSFKDLSVSLTILIIPGLLYYEKVKSSVKRFEMPSKEDYQRKAVILLKCIHGDKDN